MDTIQPEEEEAQVWAPFAPAAEKVGWSTLNPKDKISGKGKKRRKRKKVQHPTVFEGGLSSSSKNAPSEDRSNKQLKVTNTSPTSSSTILDKNVKVTKSEPKKSFDSTRSNDYCKTHLPKGYRWDILKGLLCIEEGKEQRLFLRGTAFIKLMKGSLCLSGYSLHIGCETTIDIPSWSNPVELSTIGDTELILNSKPEVEKPTFTFLLSHEVETIVIPNSWKSVYEENLSAESGPLEGRDKRILICGGKSVGKSTFMKYLINRYVSHQAPVAVLDCDVAKPEFSPPGMLTLTIVDQPTFSPVYRNMRKCHLKSFFLGSIASRSDPTKYLEMIKDLFSSYIAYVKEHFSGDERKLPLIINTDGWTKGFGFEILTNIIETIKPSTVLQLKCDNPARSLFLKPILPKGTTLLLVDGYPISEDRCIPNLLIQSIKLSAYFLDDNYIWDRIKIDSMGIVDKKCEIARYFAQKKPYLVSLKTVKCEVSGQVLDETNLDAINSSIVGLMIEKNGTQHPCCVGLGIVRGIDKNKSNIYVLSPLALQDLMSVNKIVGNSTLSMPLEFLHLGGYYDSFPYKCCRTKTKGIGGSFMKSRKNIARKSQDVRR